ncbi:hypothetical protein D3C81_2038870 [compost metagenome]
MNTGGQLGGVTGQLSSGRGFFGQFQSVVYVIALHHQATVALPCDYPDVVIAIGGCELDQAIRVARERVGQRRAVRCLQQRDQVLCASLIQVAGRVR